MSSTVLASRGRLGGRVALSMLVLCGLYAASTVAAQTSSDVKQYVGTWAGTWEGGGSGDFELTLAEKDSALSGKVAVTTDAGPYNADLKTVSIDGTKMNAKYDFPLDASAEVVLAATFEGRSAKGTWSLRPKGQDAEILSGTWAVTKK